MPQVTTKHGKDAEGRNLYTREEHNDLMDVKERLDDASFRDLVMADAEKRVMDSNAQNVEPSRKTWTREEYKRAARRTDKMTAEEFAAWQSAPEDGRIVG